MIQKSLIVRDFFLKHVRSVMFKLVNKIGILVASLFSLAAHAELDFTPIKPVVVQQAENHKGLSNVGMTSSNTVVLRGEINGVSTGKALLQVLQVKEPTVYLFLSSPGGSVIDGLNFITGLRGSGKKIVCLTDFSASMSFVIFQACNERIVFDSSIIMQHVPSMSTQGQYPNFKSFVKLLDDVTLQTDKAQARRLGISLEEFRRKTRDDLWLFGGDAVKTKAADRVGTASCSQEMIENTTTEELQVFIFTIHVTWSNCPLVQAPLKVEFPRNIMTREDTITLQKELNRTLNYRQNMITNPQEYLNK